MKDQRFRQTVSYQDAESQKTNAATSGFLIVIVIGLIAVVAIGFGLEFAKRNEAELSAAAVRTRPISPPFQLVSKGYALAVGPAIVTGTEPKQANVAVHIIKKGEAKGAYLACTFASAKGVPLGGGAMPAIHETFGGTMQIDGPLLSPGKLSCEVIEK